MTLQLKQIDPIQYKTKAQLYSELLKARLDKRMDVYRNELKLLTVKDLKNWNWK